MPDSAENIASPLVRFPNFTDIGDLHSLSIIVQDLSLIYDVTTVAVLPGYGQVVMPQCRLVQRGRQVSLGEIVIGVAPLVFHGE